MLHLISSVISPYHQAKSQPSVISNKTSPNLSDAIPNKSSLFSTQKNQTSVTLAPAPPQGNYTPCLLLLVKINYYTCRTTQNQLWKT